MSVIAGAGKRFDIVPAPVFYVLPFSSMGGAALLLSRAAQREG